MEGAVAFWFDIVSQNQNTDFTKWENEDDDPRSFKIAFITKFRTQNKIDTWQDELETMKQEGTVDQYTNHFMDLLRKVNPEDEYPETYKLRLYRRGLKSDLKKWV